jgi:hypothetical protein
MSRLGKRADGNEAAPRRIASRLVSSRTVARLTVAAVASAALAGCGSSTSADASFVVWENECKTQQTFTKAEVVSTWGASAVSGEELRGTPARISKECEAQRSKEGKG